MVNGETTSESQTVVNPRERGMEKEKWNLMPIDIIEHKKAANCRGT